MTSAADKKILARMNWGLGLSLPAVLIIAIIVQIRSYNPVLGIKSPEYRAPHGCIVRPYAVMDHISASCIDRFNVIPHDEAVSNYGWQAGRAGRDYYRVGDDAYQIRCDEGNSQVCGVTMAEYGAFAR